MSIQRIPPGARITQVVPAEDGRSLAVRYFKQGVRGEITLSQIDLAKRCSDALAILPLFALTYKQMLGSLSAMASREEQKREKRQRPEIISV